MTLSIERRAALWGDRTAIVDVSESRRDAPARTTDASRISYAELAALAERTAGRLAATGIGAGDAVCVLSRNRIAGPVLFFACRRLDATFAPLSHRLTPATVDRPIDRIDPEIVVHESAQRDLVRTLTPAETVTLDELEAVDPVDPPPSPADAGPSCYLHGDDGRAVAAFPARAVEGNCVAAATTWGFGRNDHVPLLVPLSTYDGLLRTALPTLYAGGILLLDRAFDPGDALESVRGERATVLHGRAAEFRELAGLEGFDEALESVEWAASETPVADEVRDAFLERGVPLTRAYGRLECPNALARPLGAVADDDGFEPVLDCDARLVDDGVIEGPGEGTLQLSGPQLASGYVDRSADGNDRTDDRGRFADGWFDVGERFRRDDEGRYHPLEGE